jgi:hypothetical protein
MCEVCGGLPILPSSSTHITLLSKDIHEREGVKGRGRRYIEVRKKCEVCGGSSFAMVA